MQTQQEGGGLHEGRHRQQQKENSACSVAEDGVVEEVVVVRTLQGQCEGVQSTDQMKDTYTSNSGIGIVGETSRNSRASVTCSDDQDGIRYQIKPPPTISSEEQDDMKSFRVLRKWSAFPKHPETVPADD